MPFLEMFRELNRFLIEDIAASGMFVTWLRPGSMLNDAAWSLQSWPSAGYARASRPDSQLLESRSMILGALPNAVDAITNEEVELQPDDRSFYTPTELPKFQFQGKCSASGRPGNRTENILPACS